VISTEHSSPLPWSVRSSALTTQLLIVDANGSTVAVVNATSKGKKMPTTWNARLIIEAVNALRKEEIGD
jgi:hypothetical protein